jgi:hypothetical protein
VLVGDSGRQSKELPAASRRGGSLLYIIITSMVIVNSFTDHTHIKILT